MIIKKIIKENVFNIKIHCVEITEYNGCQCIKDCLCRENFKPEKIEYYIVKRKQKKTTTHKTLDEANSRWEYINSL